MQTYKVKTKLSLDTSRFSYVKLADIVTYTKLFTNTCALASVTAYHNKKLNNLILVLDDDFVIDSLPNHDIFSMELLPTEYGLLIQTNVKNYAIKLV